MHAMKSGIIDFPYQQALKLSQLHFVYENLAILIPFEYKKSSTTQPIYI